jgi:hypothetical protein
MNANLIVAESLTTFDVDDDGLFANLHVRDGAGEPATLVLPTQCLNQLLMSIPKMIQVAIRNRYRDDSLRLVHPLQDFNVEQGKRNSAGTEQFILTLQTSEGFAVSFSATENQLAALVTVVVDEVQPLESAPVPAIRYS